MESDISLYKRYRMVTIGLADLPTEILQQIATDLIDTHRLCLVSFASACRRCYAVSLSILFHTVVIRVSSRDRLRQDINALINHPWVLEHVRRLEIVGIMLPRRLESKLKERAKKEEPKDGQDGRCPGQEHNGLPDQNTDVGLIEFVERVAGARKTLSVNSGSALTAEEWCDISRTKVGPVYMECPRPYWDNDSWSPLVDLLEALPGLVDLVYDCINQFPPILFRTTLQVLPACRLQINPHRLQDAHNDFIADYNVSGPGSSLGRRRKKNRSCLTSLVMRWGHSEYNASNRLFAWSGLIDFTSLRQLSLRNINDRSMDWIVQNRPFSCLRDVELIVQRYSQVPDDLFASLSPLKSLSYLGDMNFEFLVRILEWHGGSLESLELNSRFNSRGDDAAFEEEEVRLIQERCPELKDLKIPIRRSKSGTREVAIYRILGRIKHLQTLHLRLDWRYIWDEEEATCDLDNDEFDLQTALFLDWQQDGYDGQHPWHIQHWHIRDAFLNAAVDERLAQDIWVALTDQGSHLKWLTLEHTGDGALLPELEILCEIAHDGLFTAYPQVFDDIMRHMSRHFYLQRSVLSSDERVFATELDRQNEPEHPRGLETCDELRRIFRRIWPEKPGSGDWRDDWSSVALEGIDRGRSPAFAWVDHSERRMVGKHY